ncbi:hypothetical protein DL89DRAFT_260271 [Linderina pennispora]|uniref:Uncharacterized protein n=1 Tax=Linderina pennispora TaxID=61395 RepID=A0A1Y1VZH7_9FUNG|nr:uncharacterized protein DL89DRAFT_260271 [Linderina pennispora]ORX66660.1 hypothetical protein DL89DRAFT_260271 [Linderina pennispora]
MLPSNYTLFYSTTPENEGCVAFYGGCYDTIDAGETLHEPLYRVYVKYPNIIFSAVENIVDDDTTVIAGIIPNLMTKEYTEGIAIVDMRTEKSARVIINGNVFNVEQRATQLGWKFKDPEGIKYKWNTPIQGCQMGAD